MAATLLALWLEVVTWLLAVLQAFLAEACLTHRVPAALCAGTSLPPVAHLSLCAGASLPLALLCLGAGTCLPPAGPLAFPVVACLPIADLQQFPAGAYQ